MYRYIAIRWSSSSPKRKGSVASGGVNLDAEAARIPTKLIRKDKTLAGYVLGELDVSAPRGAFRAITLTFCPQLNLGSAFVPLSMPKGTGRSLSLLLALPPTGLISILLSIPHLRLYRRLLRCWCAF